MAENHNASPFEVSASSLNIDSIVASFSDDTTLKENMQSATLIIVPTDLGSDFEGPAFPSSTREVLQRLTTGLSGEALVEIAVRENEYREFQYRSDSIIIPTLFIAKEILLPMVVNILGSFISDKLRNWGNSRESTTVKSEVHIAKENGEQIHCKYEGTGSTFVEVTREFLR